MNEEGTKPSTAAQTFWGAFEACVGENRVPSYRSIFYVKWVQAFVDFLFEERLADPTNPEGC